MEEYETAEEHLRSLIRDEDIPKRVRESAKYELGGLYYMRGQYDLAAQNYESSVRTADDELIRTMAMYRLGDCYIHLERFEEAPDLFRRAAKDAPNEDFQAQASIRWGQAESLNGEYDRAIDIFQRQLSREYDEKRIPKIKLELAKNLQADDQMQEALQWYDEIIEQHPRTDASARAYFALAEIEEYQKEDYRKAQEYYDMVRGEFSNSLVADVAQERSNHIKTLLDLERDIAKLEGREIAADSTNAEEEGTNRGRKKAGPINLSYDGMWVNYTGRDRPPPVSLKDLSEEDMQRRAVMEERMAEALASGDTTAVNPNYLQQDAPLDSAALAAQKAKEERNKEYDLAERYLALGEVLYFNFNKPDSAAKAYQYVVDKNVDSLLTARSLYSLAFIYRDAFKDTTLANNVLREIVDLFPNTPHAVGARKMLKLPTKETKVDSARLMFVQGEESYFKNQDLQTAMRLWDQVLELYPSSDYAPKAAYAKAWHFEHTTFEPEKAEQNYQLLVDEYPESAFVQKAKPKLSALEKARQEAQRKADSLAAAADSSGPAADSTAAPVDSTAIAAADSNGVAAPDTNAVAADSSAIAPANAPQAAAPRDTLHQDAGRLEPQAVEPEAAAPEPEAAEPAPRDSTTAEDPPQKRIEEPRVKREPTKRP